MSHVRRRLAQAVSAILVGAMMAGVGAPAWAEETPPAAAPAPAITNSELVVAELDPSGLPESSTLYDQVSVSGAPEPITVVNPTATGHLRYVGQRGAPPSDAVSATVTVGGGVESVTTSADFGKPLPIALHAEYRRLGAAVAPESVTGAAGDLTVVYTETNTTAAEQTLTYTTADGATQQKTVPVFAPYVGVMRVTLPPGTHLISSPGGVTETTAEGATVVSWQLVLYPPLGDYVQTQTLRINGDSLAVPAVAMEVVPVTGAEDASVGFAAKLLDGSTSGNSQLAGGVQKLDSATGELAAATATLADGLTQLQDGSAALAEGLDGAASGSGELTAGIGALATGLGSVSDGLAALSGTSGTPAIAAQLQTVAGAVQKIAAAVGSPADPPLGPDPGPTATLYQIAVASEQGAQMLDTQVSRAAAQLLQIAQEELPIIIEKLQELAQAADQAIADLQAAIDKTCNVTPEPPQCPQLRAALAWIIAARAEAQRIAEEIAAATAVALKALADIAAAAIIGEKLVAAMQAMQTGLAAVNAALVSGSATSPGVYEGLMQIAAAVTQVSLALTQLSTGAAAAAGGAEALESGSAQLTSGLEGAATGADELTSGIGAAADGSSAVADGATALQKDGTSAMYRQIVEASADPAFAAAYLQATDQRVTASMPFGAPEGATGRAAYVYTLTPPPVASSVNWGAVAAAALALMALLAVAYRRIAGPGSGAAIAGAGAGAGAVGEAGAVADAAAGAEGAASEAGAEAAGSAAGAQVGDAAEGAEVAAPAENLSGGQTEADGAVQSDGAGGGQPGTDGARPDGPSGTVGTPSTPSGDGAAGGTRND